MLRFTENRNRSSGLAVTTNPRVSFNVLGLRDADVLTVTATGGTEARTLGDHFADVKNVLDYGALGDGSTNDTVAIQAALNAAGIAGGAVFFPPGEYVCSRLSWPGDVVLIGAGNSRDTDFSIGITELKLPNSSASGAYIIASSTYVDNNAFVNLGQAAFDIHFNGNKANQSNDATACVISRCFRARFERCTFEDSSGHGLLFTCESANGTDSASIGESGCVYCDFDDNDFAGVYCDDDGANHMADIFIRGCNFAGNGQVDDVNKWRNFMSERSAGFHIIDNQMYGCPNGNILLQGAGLCTISNNQLESTSGGDGDANVEIAISGFAQLSITGNVFWDQDSSAGSPKTHLLLTKGSVSFLSIAIAGNTFSYSTITGANAVHITATSFTGTDKIGLVGNSYYPNTTIPSGSPFIGEIDGNVRFPATQGASSDVNTLDDYEEGNWTPTITFATPGDLSVSYNSNTGRYVKVGKMVTLWFSVVTSSFTYTTASSTLLIPTIPFAPASDIGFRGCFNFQGITKANYTQFTVVANAGVSATSLFVEGTGSAQSSVNLVASDFPSGGTVLLKGTISYFV